jgi:hypothetical protein
MNNLPIRKPQNLHRLPSLPCQGSPDWFEENFRFDSLRDLPGFQALVAQSQKTVCVVVPAATQSGVAQHRAGWA